MCYLLPATAAIDATLEVAQVKLTKTNVRKGRTTNLALTPFSQCARADLLRHSSHIHAADTQTMRAHRRNDKRPLKPVCIYRWCARIASHGCPGACGKEDGARRRCGGCHHRQCHAITLTSARPSASVTRNRETRMKCNCVQQISTASSTYVSVCVCLSAFWRRLFTCSSRTRGMLASVYVFG